MVESLPMKLLEMASAVVETKTKMNIASSNTLHQTIRSHGRGKEGNHGSVNGTERAHEKQYAPGTRGIKIRVTEGETSESPLHIEAHARAHKNIHSPITHRVQ